MPIFLMATAIARKYQPLIDNKGTEAATTTHFTNDLGRDPRRRGPRTRDGTWHLIGKSERPAKLSSRTLSRIISECPKKALFKTAETDKILIGGVGMLILTYGKGGL